MTIPRLGLLGGGQLARMLALDAYPLGYPVSVLTLNIADPAAQVVPNCVLGALDNEDNLREFLSGVDIVTFESEFVDTVKLAKVIGPSPYVFPKLKVIELIQDRVTQKKLLDQFEIATSPWIEVETGYGLHLAAKKFSKGFVLKQRRYGYDGYGTFIMKPGKRDESVLQKSKHGFIAENLVKFKRELAISFVRSKKGQFLALPLVESVQQDARCFSVCGPIAHPGIKKLTKQFEKLMRDLDYVGVLAVELFDVNGELMVNELAPRVHNSAHYSQNALTCSQFEYHWRAGLGLELPPVKRLAPAFAMVNLLGEGGTEIVLARTSGGFLHWYGKTENRAGRKLGHLNTLDKTPEAALKAALNWRKEFKL